MKEIFLRSLNYESKENIVEIVEEYLSRNYVETTIGSTAVELLTREFRGNERRTKSEIEGVYILEGITKRNPFEYINITYTKNALEN